MEQLLWLKYKVKEPLNWVGHLALMRVFERAWRRSKLPVAYSQGFNPRIRQSFGLPLVLGATSDCEYSDIRFAKWVNVREVHDGLSAALHSGVELSKVILAPTLKTSLMQILCYADFELSVSDSGRLEQALGAFQLHKQVFIAKKTKHSIKDIDIKPLIKRIELLRPGTLGLRLQSGEQGTLKPLELLKALDPGLEPFKLHRVASLDGTGQTLF